MGRLDVKTGMGKLLALFSLGLFVAFGAAAIGVTGYGIVHGMRSQHWPNTMATIEVSKVKTRSRRRGRKSKRLIIRYRYQVDDHSYSYDRARFLQNVFVTNSAKESISRQFPVDSVAPVYFDPSDPQNAVLIPGVPWLSAIGGLAVGSLLVVVGVWPMRALYKR